MIKEPEVLLSIREIAVGDADAAAALSGELGYPVSAAVMEQRIRDFARCADHVVFVACAAAEVVGWIDVGLVQHLQGERYGEIGGLVVGSAARSRGVGRQLVACAEQWVRERGVERVLVRSQIAREAAHRFYEREGYTRIKTSAVFSKALV